MSPTPERVNLTGDSETALMTLRARAREAARPDGTDIRGDSGNNRARRSMTVSNRQPANGIGRRKC